MNQLQKSSEQLIGDNLGDPRVKNSRRRLHEGPNALPAPHKDPNTPKRGPGRPRKKSAVTVYGGLRKVIPARAVVKGRGRGRPKKSKTPIINTQKSPPIMESTDKDDVDLSRIAGLCGISPEKVEEVWPGITGTLITVTVTWHSRSGCSNLTTGTTPHFVA